MPEPKKTVSKPTVGKKDEKRTVALKEKKRKILAEREVKYPYYKVLVCANDDATHTYEDGKPVEYDGPVTAELAKQLLDWETEPDYVKKKLSEDPNYKESKLKFGSEFVLKDADGNKVVCWNNCTNRPFDLAHAKELAQDILTKNWVVNCENIVIGRTGLVISGQHRLIGLILAVEEWRKQPHWQEVWETEPVIESMIAFGCSEDAKVIRTIDNVKPRSLGDVFYTSPLFADKSQSDRAEMSKMLSFAVQLLWKRTRGDGDQFVTEMTHSAAIDFQERHQKLLACIKHIFDEDGGKKPEIVPVKDGEEKGEVEEIRGKQISGVLRVQRGHAAALMYLMAQSKTDPDKVDDYYMPGANKSEKRLDWSHWDLACQFWSELAEQELGWTQTVKEAMAELNFSDPESNIVYNATNREKWCVLTTAWNKYRVKENFEFNKPEKLHPNFTIDETTNRRKVLAVDEPLIGGIDKGTVDEDSTDDTALTKEQVEEEKEKTRADSIKKTLAAQKPKNEVRADDTKKTLPMKEKPKGEFGRDANNAPIKNGKGGKAPASKKPALRGGTATGAAEEPF